MKIGIESLLFRPNLKSDSLIATMDFDNSYSIHAVIGNNCLCCKPTYEVSLFLDGEDLPDINFSFLSMVETNILIEEIQKIENGKLDKQLQTALDLYNEVS